METFNGIALAAETKETKRYTDSKNRNSLLKTDNGTQSRQSREKECRNKRNESGSDSSESRASKCNSILKTGSGTQLRRSPEKKDYGTKRNRSGSDSRDSLARKRDSILKTDDGTQSRRSPEKKDYERKRNRSGSDSSDNRASKYRRHSRTGSRNRERRNQARERSGSKHNRGSEKSDEIQSKINQLKKEIEREKEALDQMRLDRRSNSKSVGQSDRYSDSQRSCSRSKDKKNHLPNTSLLPSVRRFLNRDSSGESKVVAVSHVKVRDDNVQSYLLTRFKRYGEILEAVYDKDGNKAYLFYKHNSDAEDSVKAMNNRYFQERHIKVEIINKSDINLPTIQICSYCSRDHKSSDCPDFIHRRRRESRSHSIDLNWPTDPCHPSSDCFKLTGSLSPLSLVHAAETLQTDRIRPPALKRNLSRAMSSKSQCQLLGQERFAQREAMNQVKTLIKSNRSIKNYYLVATVGKGSYGQMYKAVDKDKETLMALKKVESEYDGIGFPASALHEVRLQSRLNQSNIMKLVEIIRDESFPNISGTLYVYDYMNHDLKGLLQSKSLQLKTEDIAWLIKQLLEALSYCHRVRIVHCDVKPSNILINNRGDLKLTQFGLACLCDDKLQPESISSSQSTATSSKSSSARMVSLWYRSPELLLGDKNPKPAVDIWSCGCVIGEMFLKKPIFLGSDEAHQVQVISEICGTPNASVWPNVINLSKHYFLKNLGEYARRFHDSFHFMPYMARTLLDKLLEVNPTQRLSAEMALEVDWLKNVEFPRMLPVMLTQIQDSHLLMPIKPPAGGQRSSLPESSKACSKASVFDFEKKTQKYVDRNTFLNKTETKDISGKSAVTEVSESTYVPEAGTCWMPLKSLLSREQTVKPDVDVRRELVQYPCIGLSGSQTFKPELVKDYQSSFVKKNHCPKEEPFTGLSSSQTFKPKLVKDYQSSFVQMGGPKEESFTGLSSSQTFKPELVKDYQSSFVKMGGPKEESFTGLSSGQTFKPKFVKDHQSSSMKMGGPKEESFTDSSSGQTFKPKFVKDHQSSSVKMGGPKEDGIVDISDKSAVTEISEGTHVPEAGAFWMSLKSLLSREQTLKPHVDVRRELVQYPFIGLSSSQTFRPELVKDCQSSSMKMGGPKEESFIGLSSGQTFKPKFVKDHQASSVKMACPMEETAAQLKKSFEVGVAPVTLSNQVDRFSISGIENRLHYEDVHRVEPVREDSSRSFDMKFCPPMSSSVSKPDRLDPYMKPAASSQIYSGTVANLERLRMLNRKLEGISKAKCENQSNLLENSNSPNFEKLPLKTELGSSIVEPSLECTDVMSQGSFISKSIRENRVLQKRSSFSDAFSERTSSIRANEELSGPFANMESGGKWSSFGTGWEENDNRIRNEASRNLASLEEWRYSSNWDEDTSTRPVDHPVATFSNYPAMGGDSRDNNLQRSLSVLGGGDQQTCNDMRGSDNGWNCQRQPAMNSKDYLRRPLATSGLDAGKFRDSCSNNMPMYDNWKIDDQNQPSSTKFVDQKQMFENRRQMDNDQLSYEAHEQRSNEYDDTQIEWRTLQSNKH